MASQPFRGREDVTSLEVHSYIIMSTPTFKIHVGEVLPFEREPNNYKDSFVVAIKITDKIFSHVPFNLAISVVLS